MKKFSKSGLRTIFVLTCLLAGLLTVLIQLVAFTKASLIETLLVCVSLAYLIIKFFTSSLIIRYQQEGYHPSPQTRKLHMLLTAISTETVLPLCIDFLIACAILFAFKSLTPEYLPLLARWVYDLYSFNEKYIEDLLSWTLIILALITLLRYMSHRILKRYRKYIAWLTAPIGIVCLLAYFVHADRGIKNMVIVWNINTAVPAYDKVALTFNAGTEEKSEMKAIIENYVELFIRELSENEQFTNSDSMMSSAVIERRLILLQQYEQFDPAIKSDIFDGKAAADRQPEPAYREGIEKLYGRMQKALAGVDDFKPTSLYKEVYQEDSRAKRKRLLAVLLDDNEQIGSRQLTDKESLMAEILKEFLGETWFFKGGPEHIRFYAFAKDASFDLLKDRCAKGLLFLLKRMTTTSLGKFDLTAVRHYIVSTTKNAYHIAATHLQKALTAVGEFSEWYRLSINRKKEQQQELLKSVTRERVKAFLLEFPNALDGKYLMESATLLDALKNKDASILLEADMAYWHQVSKDGKGLDMVLVRALERQQAIQQIIKAGTQEAAMDFALRYPDDQLTIEIKKMGWYGEMEALSKAKSTNSSEGWTEFLLRYPNTEHRPAIEKAISEAKIERIRQIRTTAPLRMPKMVAAEESFLQRAAKFIKKVKIR